MAKRKDIEATSGEPAASPQGAPEQAKSAVESGLPNVESPPLSPDTPAPAIEPIVEPVNEIMTEAAPAVEAVPAIAPASATDSEAPAASAPTTAWRFAFKARHKRHALLAASVAIAAAFGAVIGALASGGFGTPLPRTDVASLEERKSMQQSIARLGKEVTTLKSSIEAANKSAHTQIAKINDKLNDKIASKTTERFDRAAAADITGSISAPQTVSPHPAGRLAPRAAAVASQPPARAAVVQDWTIRDSRDGFVYVQGHGDIYQVVPGAPLPGLGAVESIKRQDGRWVVVTPKGIIVSMRDRRYFERF